MAYIVQFIYSEHWGMKPVWSKLPPRLQHAVVGEDFYKLIWKKILSKITSYYLYTIINFFFFFVNTK